MLSYSNRVSFYDISFKNKQRYCNKFGIDFKGETERLDFRVHLGWNKLAYLKRYMNYFDYVFWTDDDSLIMNFNLDLRKIIDLYPKADIIFSLDQNSLNSGHFFVKNTKVSKNLIETSFQDLEQRDEKSSTRGEQYVIIHYLKKLLGHKKQFLQSWENTKTHMGEADRLKSIFAKQGCMKELYDDYIQDERFVLTWPTLFNSYVSTYKEGDFIIHFAGVGDRQRLMKSWSLKTIKM